MKQSATFKKFLFQPNSAENCIHLKKFMEYLHNYKRAEKFHRTHSTVVHSSTSDRVLGFETKKREKVITIARQEATVSGIRWFSTALVKSIQLPRLNVFVICSLCSVIRRLFQTQLSLPDCYSGVALSCMKSPFQYFLHFFYVTKFSFL